MSKIYFVDGFQAHQAKRVCEFFFGDYFIKIKLIQEKREFHVTLKKTVTISGKEVPVSEFLDLEDFKSYWGAQWKLFYEPTPELVK